MQMLDYGPADKSMNKKGDGRTKKEEKKPTRTNSIDRFLLREFLLLPLCTLLVHLPPFGILHRSCILLLSFRSACAVRCSVDSLWWYGRGLNVQDRRHERLVDIIEVRNVDFSCIRGGRCGWREAGGAGGHGDVLVVGWVKMEKET